MIKLALFDVGDTLIKNDQPLPHVHEALQAVSRFETADGGRLALEIVSDYFAPQPPVTEARIASLEQQFVEVLVRAGLDTFFQPPESRITLSTRTGVTKPDRRIFELAAKRSGVTDRLDECLFVTENQTHLSACRGYSMTVLRFGRGPGIEPSFDDWADGPGLIAALVAPDSTANREAAVRVALTARHGLTGFKAFESPGRQSLHGQASRLVQLTGHELGPLEGVYAEIPTEVEVVCNPDGRVAEVHAAEPPQEEVADATAFVAGMLRHNQVALPGGSARGVTHEVEQDAEGRRRLVRRRYSAR